MSEKRSLSTQLSPNLKDKILFNKYKLLQKIGKGAFGSVYSAESIYSHKLYAVKLEQIQASNVLEEESLILSYINNPRIPKVKLFGYSGNFMVLIMELLGPSLDVILNSLPNKKMSIRCVCNIGYQMISIFESIHNKDIIHRDIKPSNINIGLDNKSKFLYLIDFGLSKKFRSSTTHKHYEFEQGKSLIGNARFSSINALQGVSQSRRDDLESLGYVLIFLILGKLPWQGLSSQNKEEKFFKILEKKKKISAGELCASLPQQFEEYIKYVRNLGYEEDPDYNFLKNIFLNILKNNNFEFDYYYDWDKKTLKSEEIISINNSLSTFTYSLRDKKIPKIYNKIFELKKERTLFGENYEIERFVFDIEEESNFNINKRKEKNEEENDIEIYEYKNSMEPVHNIKKRPKEKGCLPCQPKSYKEGDSSCCCIF